MLVPDWMLHFVGGRKLVLGAQRSYVPKIVTQPAAKRSVQNGAMILGTRSRFKNKKEQKNDNHKR